MTSEAREARGKAAVARAEGAKRAYGLHGAAYLKARQGPPPSCSRGPLATEFHHRITTRHAHAHASVPPPIQGRGSYPGPGPAQDAQARTRIRGAMTEGGSFGRRFWIAQALLGSPARADAWRRCQAGADFIMAIRARDGSDFKGARERRYGMRGYRCGVEWRARRASTGQSACVVRAADPVHGWRGAAAYAPVIKPSVSGPRPENRGRNRERREERRGRNNEEKRDSVIRN